MMKSPSHRSVKGAVVTAALLVLLAVQVFTLSGTFRPPATETPERIAQLALVNRDGTPSRPLALTGGTSYTALLAYDDRCAWCDSIAGVWSAELLRPPANVNVVLLSSSEPQAALEYAVRHQWNARVMHVDTSGSRHLERYVTSRTPWIYVVDPAGKLVVSQHGALLGEIFSEYRR
ncbi:MAG: hypothetical protein MUD17_11525 [Gemmatimonadaceae bacterium]|jgi:hypothetical protein|nr:hypothetical protein [Gemmatimonadaceae bacterium]